MGRDCSQLPCISHPSRAHISQPSSIIYFARCSDLYEHRVHFQSSSHSVPTKETVLNQLDCPLKVPHQYETLQPLALALQPSVRIESSIVKATSRPLARTGPFNPAPTDLRGYCAYLRSQHLVLFFDKFGSVVVRSPVENRQWAAIF
jgi:hypothetical protein